MSAPRTILLTPPDAGQGDRFGRAISSSDMVVKLQRMNPNIYVEGGAFGVWYPGKKDGVVCLWVRTPRNRAKISAFTTGMIPEWTQMSPEGIIAKGWRAIFEKIIKMQALTRRQVEDAFGVTLEYDGKDKFCPRCRNEGKMSSKATEVSGLCHPHEIARTAGARADKKLAYRKDVAAWRPESQSIFH